VDFDPRERLAGARLYLVCGELPRGRLDAAIEGGVDLVQLRMKTDDDERLLAAARRLAALCHGHGVPLILNDRPDLVEAAGADGVHVGQDDLPVSRARELVGPDRLVGLSTHSPQQIEAAGSQEVDYIGVGPIHATPTKPGRAPVGLELVAYATAHAARPFFAIGGIDPGNVDAVRAAGATRIAVVRAITEAADPRAAAAALRQEARVGAA
jgi:thiamine-phosphate pyrophosphorylase